MIERTGDNNYVSVLKDEHGNKVKVLNRPHRALAAAVLTNGIKSIQFCPKHVNYKDINTKSAVNTKLMNALDMLRDAIEKSHQFIFWCDTAEIGVDWLSSRIIDMAQTNPLLMKTWEVQK